MEKTKQILKEADIIGKTISEVISDQALGLVIVFTDNTWIRIDDYGKIDDEAYFIEDHREYNYLSKFVVEKPGYLDKIDSLDSLRLTWCGEALVRLGEITREEVIDHWVKECRSRLESKILVCESELIMAKERDLQKTLESRKSDLEKLNKMIGD